MRVASPLSTVQNLTRGSPDVFIDSRRPAYGRVGQYVRAGSTAGEGGQSTSVSRDEQQRQARDLQDTIRTQSGNTASSSGRWSDDWENRSKKPAFKGSTQRASTWSRRWEAPMQRNHRPPVTQQGPVQPATWTDSLPVASSPGSSKRAPAKEGRTASSAAWDGRDVRGNGKGSRPRNVVSEAPVASATEDNGRQSEQQERKMGPVPIEPEDAGEPESTAPVTSGLVDQRKAQEGGNAEVSSPASVKAAFHAGGKSLSRAAASRLRRGLWGRRSSKTEWEDTKEAAASRIKSGLAGHRDDWAEIDAPLPEAEDGWGSEESHCPPSTAPQQPGSLQSAAQSPDEGTAKETGFQTPLGPVQYSEEEPEILEDLNASDEAELDDGPYPDITLLAPNEITPIAMQDNLLPVVPTAEQLGSSWGSAVDVWQRLGAAAFVTLVSAKLNMFLVASGSATYPFWGPALQAANRNQALRKNGRHVGFWRTNVLEVEVQRPQRRRYTDRTVTGPAISRPVVRFLLGDESGARSHVTLPFNRRYEQIQAGEPAELLVLSMQSKFDTFKALKEVYLPASGLWLSEYPHVNRNLFLDISLDIERARQREMANGAYETAF